MSKINLLMCILLFSSCGTTYYYSQSAVDANRTRYNTSVNSYGNYNLQGKTFYIESGDNNVSSNDVEFKEYADYVSKALIFAGAKKTYDKKNADMCILVTYGISDESYTETIPMPIWGQTGISSIRTTSNTTTSAQGSVYGSSYGSASVAGNSIYGSTYGSVYGSAKGNSTTSTTTNVTPSYGITGYTSFDRRVMQYRRVLNVYAYENKQTVESSMLWKTNMVSDGRSNNLREILPAMAFCGMGWQ
ncbi:hypothetical protein FACS1894123_07020 [Bacteroidia bacterium]|nr:hypothetical protein FACS1894123_07020 [Bacteroidia bacterium]